jgi:hypothetical protein
MSRKKVRLPGSSTETIKRKSAGLYSSSAFEKRKGFGEKY